MGKVKSKLKNDFWHLIKLLLLYLFRLPRTFVIEKPLDTSKMIEEAKKKLAQPYCGVTTNCLDAVASILIAGGLTELNDYKSWGVPYPSKYISAFELRGPAGLDSVFCIMYGNSLITGLTLVIDNQNYIYTLRIWSLQENALPYLKLNVW